MNVLKEIVVCGGGAAGLVAALAAAEEARALQLPCRVTLLEKNPRVGKKLLATGNGRCNLSNAELGPQFYRSSDETRLARLLSRIQQEAPLAWLEEHGLCCRQDEAGRLYPNSNQAADLLNLFLYWLEKDAVKIRLGVEILGLEPRRGRYALRLRCQEEQSSRQEELLADKVILALGGKAGPQFGSDGAAFPLLAGLGCRVEPCFPCLVPLSCPKGQVAGLGGLRLKAAATLYDGSKALERQLGEIQFTEQGLSGIAVMQLSGLLPRCRQAQLSLDLFPDRSFPELEELLRRRCKLFAQASLLDSFVGLLPKRAAAALLKALDLDGALPCRQVEKAALKQLARGLKDWRFGPLSLQDWKAAQCTLGGVSLSAVDWDSFALRKQPGLYLVGESLDAAGLCGGYNLHWAFGSGLVAGRHAVQSLRA